MGMSTAVTGADSDDAESIRTIHRALDLGVNVIDTAEIYGLYVNEELVGGDEISSAGRCIGRAAGASR